MGIRTPTERNVWRMILARMVMPQEWLRSDGERKAKVRGSRMLEGLDRRTEYYGFVGLRKFGRLKVNK